MRAERAIMGELRGIAKKSRDWKRISRGIPFGNPNTAPHPIAKKAYCTLFTANHNNIGHVSSTGIDTYGTRLLESKAVSALARWTGMADHEGYLTTGGTESNFMGIWTAKRRLGDADICLIKTALTHYSVEKCARMLGIENIVNVPLNAEYTIDTASLNHLLQRLGFSAFIIIATVGYTTTGTCDDIGSVVEEVRRAQQKRPFRAAIHVDAALGGFALIGDKRKLGLQHDLVRSISIDGHKLGRMPYGTGFFLCRKGHMTADAQGIEYTGQQDCMLAGSRAGTSAAAAYAVLEHLGPRGYRAMIKGCLRVKEDFLTRVRAAGAIGVIHDKDMPMAAVEFAAPLPPHIERSLSLRKVTLPYTVATPERQVYVFYFMPHITQEISHHILEMLKEANT